MNETIERNKKVNDKKLATKKHRVARKTIDQKTKRNLLKFFLCVYVCITISFLLRFIVLAGGIGKKEEKREERQKPKHRR